MTDPTAWTPEAHGTHSRPAIVTASITNGRRRFGGRPGDTAEHKQRTHRRHRRAWRRWTKDADAPEPDLRSLSSREIW